MKRTYQVSVLVEFTLYWRRGREQWEETDYNKGIKNGGKHLRMIKAAQGIIVLAASQLFNLGKSVLLL